MSSSIEKLFTTNEGLKAVVLATDMGHRCGYVQCPENIMHLSYDEIDGLLENYVHGGLTFIGTPQHCDFYAVGFDCAHSCDAKDPELLKGDYLNYELMLPSNLRNIDNGKIRTKEFVIKECKKLSKLLMKASEKRVVVK